MPSDKVCSGSQSCPTITATIEAAKAAFTKKAICSRNLRLNICARLYSYSIAVNYQADV
ncbi:MAG: hypothetical protein R2942_18195 [Ignavibacteria bacterium]